MNYQVDFQPEYGTIDPKTGVMSADFYVYEPSASMEYCGTVRCSGIENGELKTHSIAFKDWHSEKVIIQVYNKELFNAIYEGALERFTAMVEARKSAG